MKIFKKNKTPYVLIVSGPTGSGKSALSLKIAKEHSGEIINADMGQFYKPFTIGTAKPTPKEQAVVPHHLFDIIDQAKSLTVSEYRKLVLDKVNEVSQRNKLPILVGGSLFYLKSLLFPPINFDVSNEDFDESLQDDSLQNKNLSPWERLKIIDPKRAEELHPNDLYRINRALEIWEKTKVKPSDFKPKFSTDFNFHFLFLRPDPEELKKRIEKRTVEMIKGDESWIDEVESIIGSDWEEFLQTKKLIGYPEIIDWIKKGAKEEELEKLIEKIQISTKQYAKRQRVFWQSFRRQLIENFVDSPVCYKFSELIFWDDL